MHINTGKINQWYFLNFLFQKWFFKRNFSERFRRRIKRVSKTGEKFIQENGDDEFCQTISESIEKFELFYTDHLSGVSESMKEMKRTLDELNQWSSTVRDLKSTFDKLDDMIGIDSIPEVCMLFLMSDIDCRYLILTDDLWYWYLISTVNIRYWQSIKAIF